MDDAVLERYLLPIPGDRVMTRQFIQDLTREASSSRARNDSLFAILKYKIEVASGDVDETGGNILKKVRHTAGRRNQANATKNTHRIELVWMSDGKVLRPSSGGGTRKVVVPKDADNKNILEEGKPVSSTKGRLEEFDYSVLDYKKDTMPKGVTVGGIYEMT